MTLHELSVSDAPSCGVILMTRVIIYDHNIFILHAPRVVIYSIGVTHDNRHIFIVQVTDGPPG